MGLLLRLLLLVTLVGCLTAAQDLGDNSLAEHSLEEKSRFKKFLNLFGIGTTKRFSNNGHQMPEFNPYQYPCAYSTTTTTPAPVVLSPLLCPFPPMLPAHLQPPQGDGEYPPQQYPHHPGGVDQLPPPPSSSHSLPPPPSEGPDSQGLRPPPAFPGYFPALPAGHPPPILVPIQPGQNPQFPFPGQSVPPYPGQSDPDHVPIQNLPNPVQPGQNPDGPTFPGPFHPSDGAQPALPSQINPERPTLVDPLNPEDPVKVNPVVTNPLDPIKVNPTIVDPSRPIPVSPVDIGPSQPLLVDPATIQPGQPLFVDPLKPPPSLTSDSLTAPPAVSDPKAFSRYPAVYPFGPTNVLINPGFPEQPPPPPPPPTTPSRPGNEQPNFGPLDRPHQFPFGPHVKPMTVLVNPGLPLYPLPQGPNGSNPPLTNPGSPLRPFLPSNIPPENIHLIPILPLPNRPNFGGNPFIPAPPLLNGHGPGNHTLPSPPPFGNSSLPPPPPLYDNPSIGPPRPLYDSPSIGPPRPLYDNPAVGPPRPLYDNPPLGPPPSNNDPIAAHVGDGNSIYPSVVPPPPPFPSPVLPLDPNLIHPEHSRPQCGTPFLKPYVPAGFHLASVNQFIGMSPVPTTRFNFPCPTLDLLHTLDFKIVRRLILSSGLQPLFEHTRNYTLFLPSDVAFRRLPRWFRESLDVDKKLQKAILLNHFVKEDLPLSLLENEELVLSARPGGNRLRLNVYQVDNTYRTITVDGAEIEKGDILSSNGRLHIVNKVLMPNLPRNAAQFLSEKLEFEGFWNLIKQADFVQNFQDARPFTLFIPVNDAVQKLNDSTFLSDKDKLRNFINYHMVNGSYYSNGLINNEFLLTNYEKEVKVQVTSDTFSKTLSGINGKVKVLKADITLTNGVAHIIDQCISEETPFYVYPQSDEFKNEYGVLRRSYRITSEEKNIENAF